METLNVGHAKLTWLKGGVAHLDGGAMFGVVPKPLWTKKYPANELNQIELRSDNILIDAGLGNDKFNEKQTRNFGIREESRIEESLEEIDLTINDIDIILMTHLHYDHANGLTKKIGDNYRSIYKDIPIYVSQIEW